MNTYTVIGLYGDNVWADVSRMREATFVAPITAPTPTMAARWARDHFSDDHERDDIEIIAVFEGRMTDVYEPSIDTDEYEALIREEGLA